MIDIEDIGLSVRAYNRLKRAGINTLEEVAKLNLEELKNIRNFGKKTVDEVVRVLEKHNLKLE